jgi:hypothetical protein
MKAAPLAAAAAFLMAACSFSPDIDPLAVQCQVGNADSCPVGYTCSQAGRCCADRDHNGACDVVPPGPDGGDAAADAVGDGPPGLDAGDAAVDAPVSDGPLRLDGTDAPDAPVSDVSAPGPDAAVDAPVTDGPVAPCGPCVSGTKSCGPKGGIRTCVDVGGCLDWSAEDPCPGNMPCAGEPSNVRCACATGGECPYKVPGKHCDGPTLVSTCSIDANMCGKFEGHETCPDSMECSGDYPDARCVCKARPAACASGQPSTFCEAGNNVLATCGQDPAGCFVVTSRIPCPSGRSCTGQSPSASCSCPGPASAGCPGVGRTCNGQVLTTCGLDANGCVTVLDTLTCGGGRSCMGTFASADCRCTDQPCQVDQQVGWPAAFEGRLMREPHILAGVQLSFDGAFVPSKLGILARGAASTGGLPRHVTLALYTDAGGEPDRLVADTAPFLARSASLDGALTVDARVIPLPRLLPSGKYWLMSAYNVPTEVYEDTVGALREHRSVPYQVDFENNKPLPDPFGKGATVKKWTARTPNHFLIAQPK